MFASTREKRRRLSKNEGDSAPKSKAYVDAVSMTWERMNLTAAPSAMPSKTPALRE